MKNIKFNKTFVLTQLVLSIIITVVLYTNTKIDMRPIIVINFMVVIGYGITKLLENKFLKLLKKSLLQEKEYTELRYYFIESKEVLETAMEKYNERFNNEGNAIKREPIIDSIRKVKTKIENIEENIRDLDVKIEEIQKVINIINIEKEVS